MRRRAIVKELTNGFIEKQQGRTGMGVSQPAGQHRQREVQILQGQPEHGRRHAYERVRKHAEWHEEFGKEQVVVLEVKREEQRLPRQLLKGVCRYCGKRIGQGIAGHERHCATTHKDS